MTQVLGHGVYSYSEAARLTGVSSRRVRAWFEGWDHSPIDPIFKGDYANAKRPDLISFLDLIDVLVVGQLRDVKASWKGIRLAYKALAKELDSDHPFGREEFYADSRGKLFKLIANQSGDKTLMEIATGQGAFPRILLPYLKKIKYDPDTRFAQRYEIHPGVILDPHRRYGKPIVESNGMPTAILANAYWANNKDKDAVAEWYNVQADEVMTAVRFESRESRRAA